jgi:ribosomal protein L12E/L44/L45/RPP1/RPP2
VEDYGKMAAATGAFAAAIVASYSAVVAHKAYHEKEMRNKEEKNEDKEDEDKHKRQNEDDIDRTGLVPSILPCEAAYII